MLLMVAVQLLEKSLVGNSYSPSKLGDTKSISLRDTQAVLCDLLDIPHAGQSHCARKLSFQNVGYGFDSLLSVVTQAPQDRATDEHEVGAECDCLEHITATSDTSVEYDGDAAGDCVGDCGEDFDGGWDQVELSDAVSDEC